MNQEEIKIPQGYKELFFSIKCFYPNFELNNKMQTGLWYTMLQDIDYNILKLALKEYASKNKFQPTIADLREIAVNIQQGSIKDAGQAWDDVQRAISNYGFNQNDSEYKIKFKNAMNLFDDLTKQCVKHIGWVRLCKSSDLMADRAHFIKIYEQLAKKEKNDRQIPVSVKEQTKLINNREILTE